jgi:hypothetical protein
MSVAGYIDSNKTRLETAEQLKEAIKALENPPQEAPPPVKAPAPCQSPGDYDPVLRYHCRVA